MTRRFPRSAIEAAWKASRRDTGDGHGETERCGRCDCPIWHGNVEWDHVKAHGLQGKSTPENCMALCRNCHREKTHREDRPIMQKADNQSYSGLKQRKPWHPGFRKRMNGSVEPR